MPNSVHTLFDSQGPIARTEPWFDPRPEQKAMAMAVERALREKHHLFVEAGTGVGKSLAYLLPAALWAIQNKKRVVVSTHTRALQEQLIAKDLPRTQSIVAKLGMTFEFALMMGSENYLCLQRLHQAKTLQAELFEGPDDRERLDEIIDFAKTATTGLRNAIAKPVSPLLWNKISRDGDLCLGRKGPYWESCLYRKDFQRARQAQILVVNHSLFFAGGFAAGADAVIFDEAHNLPEVASQFLGLTVSTRSVERLLHDLFNPTSGKGLVTRLKRAGAWKEATRTTVLTGYAASERYFENVCDHLRLSPPTETKTENAPARRIHKPLTVEDSFSPILDAVIVQLNDALPESQNEEEEIETKALLSRCKQMHARLQDFRELKKPDLAWWAEVSRFRSRTNVELRAAPLDVATYFRESVFQQYPSVIFTSATLAVGGSFELVKSQLGAPKTQEALLASPFNYRRQAALYVAHDLPDPKQDAAAFEAAAFRRCEELIPLVPGGVFLLFTSWGMLNRFAQKISVPGRTVFKQGSAPSSQLIESFKKEGNGVLLGTSTFWEGVDVPGAALSGVFLIKLPFLSPESPYEEAKEEWLRARGVNVFNDYHLPKAVVKFRQGFGRLIRGRSDHGLVAILDPRVRSKRYGQSFLKSLPDCQNLDNLQDINSFFKTHASAVPI